MLLDVGVVFAAYIGVKIVKKYRNKQKTKNHQIATVQPVKHLLNDAPQRQQLLNEVETQKHQHYLKMSAVSMGLAAMRPFYPISLVSLSLFTYTALPFAQQVEKSLVKGKKIDGYILYFIADTLTLALDYYFTAALSVGLFHLSNIIIAKTQDHSKKMLLDVFGQQPHKVWILKDNIEIEISLEALELNEIVVINAGEVVPVDGMITNGMATIDQHVLTGEAQPTEKIIGDHVFASTVVITGKIFVKVEKSGQDTTVAKIDKILNQTSDFKSNLQLKGEKWADTAILPLLIIGGLSWPILGPAGTVVILSSHISSSIRTVGPLGTMNYLTIASHNGILIKDGRVLESLNEVDTVLFDKTGTLTGELPEVGRIIQCDGETEATILTYAATAEQKLNHPIAKAILTKAKQANLVLPNLDDSKYQMGYGIMVTLDDKVIRVGSARFMVMENIVIPPKIEQAMTEAHDEGYSIVMVAVNQQLIGAIEIQAAVRKEVKNIINGLRERGIKHIAIVSGDHQQPTQKLAESLGIESYFYDILPEDKADIVEQLQQAGQSVCFVGDGINDAIAMKKANVSISLQGATTIATDVAQIVLMDGSLSRLDTVFDISTELNKNLRNSLIINLVPKIVIFSGAFLNLGILTAVTLSGSSFLVAVGNAMFPLKQVYHEKHK